MATLHLKLEKDNLPSQLPLGIVTSVRQLRGSDGKFPEDPFEEDVVVPVGQSGMIAKAVSVPEGKYRLEARLPSGEVLRETCDVGPGDSEVVLRLQSSPHEWLSLQRLAGNVPSEGQYEDWLQNVVSKVNAAGKRHEILPAEGIDIDPAMISKAARFLRKTHVRVDQSVRSAYSAVSKAITEWGSDTDEAQPPQPDGDTAAGGETAPQPEQSDIRLLQADAANGQKLWDALSGLAGWQAAQSLFKPASDCAVVRKTEDRSVTLWRISQGNWPLDPQSSDERLADRRCFALLERSNQFDCISLPTPWPRFAEHRLDEFEILSEGRPPGPGKTTLTVDDVRIGGLLMYLGNNRLSDASAIVDALGAQVEALIAKKLGNPIAACAAAYVGLATMSTQVRPTWVDWLKNVDEWFPWLPDGAIVRAMYLMKIATTQQELDLARERFTEAYKRGLPLFSAGLQQLVSGLYTFRSTSKEIEAMYLKSSSVALRTDPDQTFTVVRLLRPTTG